MPLDQFMTGQVEATSKDSTVAEAAAVMRQREIGFLPVIDGTQVIGVVTDRDLVVRGIEPGKNPDSIPLSEIMTHEVHTIQLDADVQEAVDLMKERQIQRLIVVGRDGHYEGVVTLGDLARKFDDEKIVGGTLRQISQPV